MRRWSDAHRIRSGSDDRLRFGPDLPSPLLALQQPCKTPWHLFLGFSALDPAALIDHALEQPLQTGVIEWTVVLFPNTLEDFSFSLRIVDAQIHGSFEPADFNCTPGTLV